MACFCVFAGAASGPDDSYAKEVEYLAQKLTMQGHEFIYGGGSTGLMGAFADGVIKAEGTITGVIPHFLNDREIGHKEVSRLITTDTMHERKKLMYDAADAFLILPGGLGSLDETMEVLTWRQIGLLQCDMYILNYKSYWQPMADLLDHVVTMGFMHTSQFDYLHWADDAPSMLSLLETISPDGRDS